MPRLSSPWILIGTVAAAAACTPPAAPASAPSAPLVIPPIDAAAVPSDGIRFPEGAGAPSGCFAQARHGREVACILGEYGVRSAGGDRRLVRLTNTDDGVPDLPIETRIDNGVVVLEADSRKMLDELMRTGDFVALGGATSVPVNSKRELGGLLVELNHPTEGRFRGDLMVVVRHNARPVRSTHEDEDERDDDELFHNTLSLVRCEAPALAVRVVANGLVLVERECRHEQGGQPHIAIGAWLCDRDLARCD